MPRLLVIQSSPNLESSVTRKLVGTFLTSWQQSHANVEIETLDLALQPLPHFGSEMLGSADSEASWSTQTRDAVALSTRLIEQFVAADILLIGAPMINFTICTQLKSWFDHVMIAGKTYEYSGSGVAVGLLRNKQAFVIEARGGDYADVPMNAFDFQEPLLRKMLGFMGVHDISFIRAEGMRQRVEEADDILRNAEAAIAQLAA